MPSNSRINLNIIGAMKLNDYKQIRLNSPMITQDLEDKELSLQPRTEVSPPKWHLGHTTWFFEKFVLRSCLENYKAFNDQFDHIFNSYYKQVGTHWLQGDRDQIPVHIDQILAYREHVDNHMVHLLESTLSNETQLIIETGLHHEEQHQELLHMDIQAIQYESGKKLKPLNYNTVAAHTEWFQIDEQILNIGHNSEGFSYDNEQPVHKYYIYPCQVSTQLVSRASFKQFIEDGGYKNSKFWLSKGWDWVEDNSVTQPLYWEQWPADDRPVSHVSYFEADAFANWAGYRLPTEQEHEIFDRTFQTEKDLWAWTSSQYSAYPKFKKFDGALSEYNGKFMCNQYVLRGGCKFTPENHWRPSYRNFYEPHQRWMYSGIRLARDI